MKLLNGFVAILILFTCLSIQNSIAGGKASDENPDRSDDKISDKVADEETPDEECTLLNQQGEAADIYRSSRKPSVEAKTDLQGKVCAGEVQSGPSISLPFTGMA